MVFHKIPTTEALPTYKAISDMFLTIVTLTARRVGSVTMQKPSCPNFGWKRVLYTTLGYSTLVET